MSEIKAIEKLREFASECAGGLGGDFLSITAGEIEAEIAERYIKLPTDKNGNVIHVGDMVKHADGGVYEVLGVDNDGTRQGVFINTGDSRYPIDSWCASGMELYKPRTLEDVLTEMLDRNTDGVGYREFNGDFQAFVSHCADEIRELLKAEVRNLEIDEPDTIRNELLGGDAK